MGVTNTNAYDGPFYPNGVTTSFPFTFRTMSTSEVAIIDSSGSLIVGFSFSIVPNANADGGSIIFDAPPTATDLPAFIIASAPAFGVGIDLGSVTAFNPRTLNPSFERLAVQNIFLRTSSERSLQVPFGEAGLPLPSAAERAGKILSFSGVGAPAVIDPAFNGVPINDYGEWDGDAPFNGSGEIPDFYQRDPLDLRKFGIFDSATIDQTAAMERLAAYVNATPFGVAISWYDTRVIISRDILFTKSVRFVGSLPSCSKLLCRDDAQLKMFGLRTPYASSMFSLDNMWIATEGRHGSFPVSVEYEDGYGLADASLAPTLMLRDLFISGRNRSSGFVGGIDLLNVPWPKLHNVAILGDQDGKTSEFGLRYRGKHGSMHAEGLRTYFVETGADIEGEMEGIVFDGYCEMVAVRTGIRYADSSGGLQPYCSISSTHINAEKTNVRLEGIDQFAIGQGCSFYGQPFDGTETSWTAIDLYASTSSSSIINSAVISDCVINGDGQASGKTRTGIRVNGGASYEDFVISSIRMQGLEYGLEVGANVNGLRVPDTSSTRNVAEPVRNLSIGRNLIQGLGYRYSVETLPVAAEYPGARVFVLNSSVNTFGAPVAGGGAGQVPVYADPVTNQWRVG